MGQDNDTNRDAGRPQEQQVRDGQQQQPGQQNRQGGDQGGRQDGSRIDTDGDGRTRDPNDTRPTDDGGRGAPVQR